MSDQQNCTIWKLYFWTCNDYDRLDYKQILQIKSIQIMQQIISEWA